MSDIVSAVGDVFELLAAHTPDELLAILVKWKVSIGGVAVAAVCYLSWKIGVRWQRQKDARVARAAQFLVIAKTVRDSLVQWGKPDATVLDQKLDRLERSEDALWIEDDARSARADFVGRARHALNVRRTREDYRNELERADHVEHLANYADRLEAALLKRKMPPLFNAYDDYDDRPLWQRLKGMKRRLLRRIRRDRGAA